MTDLSPCPWCGGASGTQPGIYGYHTWIGCKNAACAMKPSSQFHSEAEAIDAWNRRAAPARLPDGPSVSQDDLDPSPQASTARDGEIWQPIESAPRDGTKIDLLYPHPRGRFIDAFLDETLGWVRREPRWAPGSVGPLPEEEWTYRSLPNMLPTHWMPLPSPPREAAGPESLGVPQDEPSPSNPQDQNNINLLVADKARLDWLEMHDVQVRAGLPHGSRHLFFASTDDSFEGEIGPSDLRAKVDAQLAAEALSVVKGGETASRTDSAGEGLRPFASEAQRKSDGDES